MGSYLYSHKWSHNRNCPAFLFSSFQQLIMDLSITARTVNIEASSHRLVLANISGVTETELFSHFNIQQFIDYYGLVAVLDHIGSDAVKNHFDLTEIDK